MSYWPSNDQQYAAWLGNFITVLNTHQATFGLTAPDITSLDGAKLAFDMSLGEHVAKQAVAQAATALKGSDRGTTQDLLRPLVRRINNHPAMTNEIRAALGLPVRSDAQPNSGMVGEEVPDIFLEAFPGAILVHFGTSPANERTNGKPSWARGCNIYRKKSGEDDYTLLDFETASPYEDLISGPAADYTYIVRYRGTRAADVGRESSPATIAASGLLAA